MYEMKIRVRYSEVDREGIARLHQILEYFQDCGTFQSEELGLGVEEDQKNHRAWYLIAWNVKIIRHPRKCQNILMSQRRHIRCEDFMDIEDILL